MLYTPSELRLLLQDRKCAIVSRETGVTSTTITELANGKKMNPTYETLAKLSKYFEEQENVLTRNSQ